MHGDEGPRYAIYYVPASDTALGAMGCAVLGYDATSATELPFASTSGLTETDWAEATREPRRYGFHATLKAPFHLKAGISEGELIADVRELAARQRPTVPVGLAIKVLTRFVALAPIDPAPSIDRLAAEVVDQLDWLRAPLTEKTLARRLGAGLSKRQNGYLDTYGYPYVMEEFRFHMTLAGPLEPEQRTVVKQSLSDLFAAIDCRCVIDALTVMRQGNTEARFRVIERCALRH